MALQKYQIDKDYQLLALMSITIHEEKSIRISNALLNRVNFLHVDSDISAQKISISSFDGEFIDLYIYKPKHVLEDLPCMVYYHGGGFFLKGDALSPKILSEYVRYANIVIVYVDYRLSLDYPYPTPLKDCYSGLEWVFKNDRFLGINPNKIIVTGFSAGGALAAGVTLMARDKKGPDIKVQALISPVTDHRQITHSVNSYTDTPNWNSLSNKHMWELYLRDLELDSVPYYASPGTATSYIGLPPAYIELAQFDPLHDEGYNYANSLKKAGVDTLLNDTKGSIHMSSIHMKSKKTQNNMKLMLDFIKGYVK
ncbi:MAG: alpha/beta hydrolase [Spirochaetaceae bacterium]